MVCPATGVRSTVPPGHTSARACRSVPGPASLVLVTLKVELQTAVSPAVRPNVTMVLGSVEAVTVLPPTVELACTMADATPLLFDCAVVVTMPAPEKVTVTPATGFEDRSVTDTTSGLANVVPSWVHCPSPETFVIITEAAHSWRLGVQVFCCDWESQVAGSDG